MPGDIGNRASSASSFTNSYEGQDGYIFLGQWDTLLVESKMILFSAGRQSLVSCHSHLGDCQQMQTG